MKHDLKISEVAKELGVSPQAVYKRVNKTFKQHLKPFVYKNDKGVTLVKPKGIEIIKESFKQPFNEPFSNNLNNGSSELIEILREQLAAKDKQINDLSRQLEIMQHLLKSEQEKGKLLIEAKPPRGFKRWFGTKKDGNQDE